MIYAHTTRKTDLLYKIFHLNHVFMTPMTRKYLSVIEPTWANGAHNQHTPSAWNGTSQDRTS